MDNEKKTREDLLKELADLRKRIAALESYELEGKPAPAPTSEAFNRRIIESSHDCIKILDLEGRLQFMNQGGQRLMEIEDITPYLNASWLDFWQGQDREAALKAVSRAKKGLTGTFRGYCATACGTPKWWDVIITPIAGRWGRIEQLLSVSRDITAGKRAEDRIRHLNAVLRAIRKVNQILAWIPMLVF